MDPMSIYKRPFLLQSPSIFFDIGIQMIVPSDQIKSNNH